MSFLNKRNKETRRYDIGSSPCGLGLTNALLDIQGYSAMELSAIYSATSIISNSVALLPILVNIRENNKKLILEDHFIYHLFDNTLMTKFTTMKTMMMDLLLHGNAFAYIERDGSGTPVRLRYVSNNDIQINFDQQSETLSYTISKFNKTNIQPKDIIHLTINAADGVNGRGILFFAKKSIALAKHTDKAASNYFSSGCQVHGILSTDAPRLTDEQRKSMKQSWIQSQIGDGTGIAVLEAGMRYQPVAGNAEESQMTETRMFNLNEICRFFNISPIMLGDLSHTQYGSIEQAQIEFVQHCLMPYVEMIENEFDRKLLNNDIHFYVNFDTNVLLKSDKSTEANYITTLVSNGIWTVNEGRAILGFNDVEGGDKILIPFTNIEDNTIAEIEE